MFVGLELQNVFEKDDLKWRKNRLCHTLNYGGRLLPLTYTSLNFVSCKLTALFYLESPFCVRFKRKNT